MDALRPRRLILAAFAILFSTAFALALTPHPEHPKQGLVDMLLEYLEARYPAEDLQGDILYVSVLRQSMFHVRSGQLLSEYRIATAKAGLGEQEDSYRTPTGLHRISEKIGAEVPPLGILKDRRFTGELADPDFAGVDKDWITSRVLWLDGQEPGVNRGEGVDSRARFIYIHGTANESSIGRPSSMGCIRMRNSDVIALFDQVPDGSWVVILDN